MAENGRSIKKLVNGGETEYPDAEVRQAFRDVFGFRLEQDLTSKSPTEDKVAFLQRRLKIRLNAVKIGYPVVLKRIEAEGLTIELPGSLGNRRYFLNEAGDLVWQLAPRSQDPFEQAEFYKEATRQNLSLEGKGDPWKDPYFVDYVLQEGVKQQERLYQEFDDSYSTVLSTEEETRMTLRYLDSPALYFEEIKEAGERLRRLHKNTGRGLQELFIETFFIPGDRVLEIARSVLKITRDVQSLHSGLFLKDGQPVVNRSREVYENTFIVELICNPKSASNLQSLQDPTTRAEHAVQVLRLINQVKKIGEINQIKETFWLFANQAFENRKEALKRVFQDMGISQSLGLEFVQRLLIDRLSQLPGGEYVIDKPSPWLNHLYRLRKRVKPEQIAPPEVRFDEDDFVRNLIINEKFSPVRFRKTLEHLTLEQRKSVVSKIFDSRFLREDRFQKAMEGFIRGFCVEYSDVAGKLEVNMPAEDREKLGWLPVASHYFLKTCVARIKGGDTRLFKIFADLILKPIIPERLREQEEAAQRRKYPSRIHILYYDGVHGRITQEEVRERIVDQTAIYALQQYYSRYFEAGSRDLPLSSYVENSIVNLGGAVPEFSKRYDILQIRQDVYRRINEIIDGVKTELLSKSSSANWEAYVIEALGG